MHYVDEGDGPTLLFVHGNPSWSFEYRRLIRDFSRTHRCIAVDHLGFGLSDKPRHASYLPQWHAANLTRLVEGLDLRGVTIVTQDWGGPISLAVAIAETSRFSGFVVSNSWFFAIGAYTILRRFSRIVGSRFGRWLCERFNFFPRVLLKASTADKSALTPAIHRHYLAPFDDPASRTSTWVFPKSIVGEGRWAEGLWEQRERIAHLPCLLLWGMKDNAFAPLLPRWEEAFPNARTVRLHDVGHNVAEESGARFIAALAAFLGEKRL